jgi:hypothetical protein
VTDLTASFRHDHALDVVLPTASVLCERIRAGLLKVSGTEMHDEVSAIIYTALRAYFETYEFKLPPPSVN